MYDEKNHQTSHVKDIKDQKIRWEGSKNWTNITGITDEIIRELALELGLSYYLFEDIVEYDRPHFERLGSFMIFTLKDLTLDAEKATITGNTVYIILGKDIVVTLSKKQMFTKIEARLGDANDRIRSLDSSYLVYIMMDYMIDKYFKTVERVNETIEKLQQRVTSQPGRKNVTDINLNRRKVLFIQKNIQPLIRVMNGLQRDSLSIISDESASGFRLLENQIFQLLDEIESSKELLNHLLEVYMSNVSNYMNDVMKVLSIIGTVFLPLTFITGIYGMNFRYMPERYYRYAYPIVLFFMLILGVALVQYLIKKWV